MKNSSLHIEMLVKVINYYEINNRDIFWFFYNRGGPLRGGNMMRGGRGNGPGGGMRGGPPMRGRGGPPGRGGRGGHGGHFPG